MPETYYLQFTMGTKAVMCDVIADGHTPLSSAVSTWLLALCWCRCWWQGTCRCWRQGTGTLSRAGMLFCTQRKVKHQRMSEGKIQQKQAAHFTPCSQTWDQTESMQFHVHEGSESQMTVLVLFLRSFSKVNHVHEASESQMTVLVLFLQVIFKSTPTS